MITILGIIACCILILYGYWGKETLCTQIGSIALTLALVWGVIVPLFSDEVRHQDYVLNGYTFAEMVVDGSPMLIVESLSHAYTVEVTDKNLVDYITKNRPPTIGYRERLSRLGIVKRKEIFKIDNTSN